MKIQFIFSDRLYSDKHEWILIKENIGTVGISSYAQEALGDVVYVELPDVGKIIKKEGKCRRKRCWNKLKRF